jgi:pimeloyl-ACP methyl ester carboxylesterase
MDALTAAERRLFDGYGLPYERRRLRLADPDVEIGVLETGTGTPVLFVHGSGMSGATWAPMLAELRDRRCLAVDLPGFGASDPYDYSGRSLREHAVAQMRSIVDALGLDRVPVVGTSLGGMWALNLAFAAPERVSAVVSLGMPAVASPGVRADPYFRLMTTPGLGRLVARAPKPRSPRAARASMRGVIGRDALERTPDAWFDAVGAAMARPGWRTAMWSHLNLAFRAGRARPGNAFRPGELALIAAPVTLLWGADDPYGPPELAHRAAALMPNATVEVVPGRHAPFLDDPARCAQVVRQRSPAATPPRPAHV